MPKSTVGHALEPSGAVRHGVGSAAADDGTGEPGSSVLDESAPDHGGTTEATAADGEESESGGADLEAEGSSAVTRARRGWGVRAAIAVLAVIAVASSVCAGILGMKLRDRDDIDAAARQASVTAQNYAVTLTSIDSQHIDQNFTDVLNGATGEFKDMYAQSSSQLKKLLVESKAVSKGKVIDSSIKSASVDKVEVLLFVDQEVTNAMSPEPRIDRSRIVMTMQRLDGRWLAGKVEMA